MEESVACALPTCIATMNNLLSNPEASLSDVDTMRAWEADFTLFSHTTLLAESIAQDTLHISPPLTTRHRLDHDPCTQTNLQLRTELLQSMRNIQLRIQKTLQTRVDTMRPKPRLYRLAERLALTTVEVRAFVFIILTCTGMDGPPADERRQTPRPRSELFTCRQFARMDGHQLLHFLSPSRKHFAQGLLEVDEEFAAMYTENRFRAPREVLKAMYGCTLTLDEAMTFGNSALSSVLSEEPGSIQPAETTTSRSTSSAALTAILGDSQNDHASTSDATNVAPGINGQPSHIHDQHHEFDHSAPSARECTTDNSAVLELLSELRLESSNGHPDPSPKSKHHIKNAPVDSTCTANGPDADESRERTGHLHTNHDGGNHHGVGDDDAAIGSQTPDTDNTELDGEVYEDDMDYLKDGFEVVQEACKVYNFREKNSEEDRYTNTKRPVEALQREADAKLRKASALFMRRLGKTKAQGVFTPRLELLVDKLKLAHFERMVILTLVGAVLSQSIRKTLRSDPSLAYEAGITVGKLLRVHCDGDLRKEIKSRCFFYRNATLIRSGIVTIDVPYNMSYSDLGDFCCELDHMVLDYVAGLQTKLEEIMDSARCYTPKVDMDSVILPKKMKDLVLQRAENFDIFRRLRKEVGFDDIVRYGKGLTLFFHGKSGTGKTLFANALASHLKKKLLVVDFTTLNNSKHSNADAYRIVFREAKIHGAIVFIDECDELFESRDRGGKGSVTVALREMETFDGIMILATNRPQLLDEAMHRRIALSLMFEPPDAKHRLAIWEKHIPKNLRLADDVDLKALAIEFELTGGFIKNAVFQALAQAVNRVQRKRLEEEKEGGKGKEQKQADDSVMGGNLDRLRPEDVVVTMTELRHSCRLQARGDLKRSKLERRVLPVSGLDKLVTTPDTMAILRDVVNVEKVRAVMATRWGFKDRQSRSNCVLIFGPSGCGKSFAAGCLGFETGRPLQRLSASELHGSREGTSQIGDVFGQAAVAGAVVVVEHAEQLLFEAGSVDTLASPGLELLFHMQSFDGLVVMCCTTAESSGDAGWPSYVPIPSRISSLLSYIVVLKMPNKEARQRLWRQLIPNDTPLRECVDEKGLNLIAEKYELSGARIASCIRRAAAAVAMKRNRASLLETSASDVEAEKVGLEDLKQACEAEIKLKAETEGNSMWATGLFV